MTILRLHASVLAAVLIWSGPQKINIPPAWSAPVEPFRIIDTIYYVGTEDLASYLVTTPEGHFVIDTGLAENAGHIAAGIEKLGFKLRDVKFLLTTQAHFDHVAAHAEMKKRTGATVAASERDAVLMEAGGKGDYLFGAAYQFPSVPVERRIKDGDVLKLGSVELRAHLTPGHTPGTTTWTTTVKSESGAVLHATFVGSTAVNEGTRLTGNESYPGIRADYLRSFEVLSALKTDVFLAAHLSAYNGLHKMKRLKAGDKPNPFIDPAGFASYLRASRKNFEI